MVSKYVYFITLKKKVKKKKMAMKTNQKNLSGIRRIYRLCFVFLI